MLCTTFFIIVYAVVEQMLKTMDNSGETVLA